MKKLLLVALMAVLGLSIATDAFGLFGRRRFGWGGYRGYGFGGYGYGGGYGFGGGYGYGGGCGRGACSPCAEPAFEQCPPPPCCEQEQTITVRVPPQLVCGWVCPDGTNTIPTSEARLVGE